MLDALWDPAHPKREKRLPGWSATGAARKKFVAEPFERERCLMAISASKTWCGPAHFMTFCNIVNMDLALEIADDATTTWLYVRGEAGKTDVKQALIVAMPIKALTHMDPYVGNDVKKEDDIWRIFFTIAREFKDRATDDETEVRRCRATP